MSYANSNERAIRAVQLTRRRRLSDELIFIGYDGACLFEAACPPQIGLGQLIKNLINACIRADPEHRCKVTFISSADEFQSRSSDCSIFEHALDALPDGVLLVNAARKVVYTNAAFKRLWSMPAAPLASTDDGENLKFVMDQLVDPEGFRREVERLHPTTEISQDEIAFKDGRIISRRSLPFEEMGKFSARIWIFTDITEARNATVDQLTQLANRLAFSREFPPFVTAPSDGLVRAVAIVDLDHFKQYNDLYGHAQGDEALRKVGAILRLHAGHNGDQAFRIGGEEFLMTLRARSSEAARTFFEHVRGSVEALGSAHAGNDPYGVITVSMGVHSFRSSLDAGCVFQNADDAVYQAKALGHNRIVEASA